MRWRCTYKGAKDSISAAGVAAPSWHTFDKREWKSDDFKLVLRHHPCYRLAVNKGRMYEILLYPRGTDMPLFSATGYNWTLLVKVAKQYAEETGPGNLHGKEPTDG